MLLQGVIITFLYTGVCDRFSEKDTSHEFSNVHNLYKIYQSLLQLIFYALEFASVSPSVIVESQWLEFLIMCIFQFHARVYFDALYWNSNISHLHGPFRGYKPIYKYMQSTTFS